MKLKYPILTQFTEMIYRIFKKANPFTFTVDKHPYTLENREQFDGERKGATET